MAFLIKDYQLTKQLLELLTEEHRAGLNEFYLGLIEKAQKEIEKNDIAIQELSNEREVNSEEQTLLSKIAGDATDLESKYSYAKFLYENGRFEDSINQAIEIIKRNNNWNENQAFNLLNEIFNELGNTNELVVASRKKLSEILN